MAIAFANLGASTNPDISSGTDATSYANSSWTPPTEGLIIAFVIAKRAAALDTPTISGNGLTWVQIGSTLNCGGTNHGLSLFAADAAGSTTGVTTVSFGANTQLHCSTSFFHATGIDLTGGVAAAFVQQPTNTGTGATGGTVSLAAASAAANRPIAAFIHFENEAKTPRANWTEIDDLSGTSGTRNLETQYRSDAFETTASATWATSANWGGMAAELKAANATISLQVNASANDAQELVGTVTTDSTTMWAASTTAGWVGLRFLNVTIPQGATINTATLYVYVNDITDGQDEPVLDIYCEDVDSAAIFTTTANSISSRARTTASINWTEDIGAIGFADSPDIASAVQEVIDRGGWASGNALVVLFDGMGSGGFNIRTYDSLPTEAARLDIVYTVVSTVSAADTVTLTEAVSRRLVSLVSAGETVTLTETVSRRLVSLVSKSETVTLTEAKTVSVATPAISQNQAVTLTEARSVILASLVSQAETITVTESSTAVLLVSLASAAETITLSEAVTVALAAFSVSAGETVTLAELVLINTGTSLLVSVSEAVLLSEATGTAVWETVSIIIYDTLGLTDATEAPLFSITDTLTLTDEIIGTTIADTLTLTDEVAIGNVTVVVTDTLTFSEVLELDGPTVTPPATAASSELDYNPVLKLLYGNDKRNPIRELDLAQLAPGSIRLMAGGFAPGAGERNELWSGESIRFDGQKKLAESRKNSQLAVTCVLKTGGSQAALSYYGRKISRFFNEAKQHQLLGQNHTVWLEYRWSDGLPDLSIPTFGQLSNYYEVFSATAPKWPDSLHDDLQSLTQGLIADVLLNITGSPAPEGLKQRAATAGGTITLHDKGVLIASGASSRLHWSGYTSSGLTGNFTITGWITLNATWGSGNKDVFDYYVSASNRIRIIYDATNTRWTITKIVSGSTFTANSSSDVLANGDDVHLQLVQDATTLYLYVNGVLAVSVTATNTMTDGGLIALGCPGTGTIDGVDVILDGWRIMPDDITSTYALALYEAELPIKQDGGQVGSPLYWWTKDGDGQVDNCDESGRDNWGIIGGVGGDIEAEAEIQFSTAADNKYYWLGIRPQDDILGYNPFWFEASFVTVTSDSASSGGSYSLLDPATSLTGSLGGQGSSEQGVIFGRYQLLMRIKISGAASFTTGWSFSGLLPFGTLTTPLTNTIFKVLSFGDMFLQTDTEDDSSLSVVLHLGYTAAAPVALGLDFGLLLPYPFAKITRPTNAVAPGSITPLVIVGGKAHTHGALRLADVYEYEGGEIAAIPNKYNYLYFLQLASDETFARTDVADITVYVTPRYLLPGGMVA